MPLHIRLWQHKNGFWYLMIPPEMSSTGQWQQRSTKSKNKRVAERCRSRVQEFGLGALFGETNAPPLKEFLKNYSEFIEVSNSHGERTVELYDEIVPRVLKACNWPPTTQELLHYWKGRIDEKEIRPITANKERRAVHSALQWAVKGGLLSENPCSRVPQFELAEGQKEVKDDWYTDDELTSILEWLPDRYRPLVL